MKKYHAPRPDPIMRKGHAHQDSRPDSSELELEEGLVEFEEFAERRRQALQARALSRFFKDLED